MEHCIVKGERCFSCCKVLTITEDKDFREDRQWVKRHGVREDHRLEDEIFRMVRPISKRRAKKINPRLVGRVGNDQAYFTCINLTASGCGNYEGRPGACRGYPWYNYSEKEIRQDIARGPLYDEDCTYYLSLP